MKLGKGEFSTRGVDEVRERIAEILGYCHVDGELHDPEEFEKKTLRSRWKCPDCEIEVGEISYRRASELRWLLTEKTSSSDASTQNGDEDGDEDDDGTSVNADEKASSLMKQINDVEDSVINEVSDEPGPTSKSETSE